MIAIIVAMDKELNLLLPLLDSAREFNQDGYNFFLGNIQDTQLVIMKSGIGKVNAALATQVLIKNFAPKLVINSGVAGGVGGDAGIMDIVVADRITYSDVWCGPGTNFGQAADCPLYFDMFELPVTTTHAKVKKGLICSSDRFIASDDEVAAIRSRFPQVMAVDMESGAIAQTCFLASTPCAVIRVVSDTPGEADNISQYEDFWVKAPEATFQFLKEVLAHIDTTQFTDKGDE